MDCGMMSGIGSRIFFPGVRGMSAARRQTIGFSSARFSIAIGRAFPGAIYRRILVPGKARTSASADGARAAFSIVS